MRIFKVNILSNNVLETADAICFTSNGVIRKDGRLVMGAGVAKAFRDRFSYLDAEAAKCVETNGNCCQLIGDWNTGNRLIPIVAFPTKHHWRNPSDIKLIEKSVNELIVLADTNGWKTIYLPAPGVSNGGLSWENEVKPLLIKKLDDRFIITFLPKGKA